MSKQFSSGGIVYRKSPTPKSQFLIKWLVTKSAPSKQFPKGVWRFPKGRLDNIKGSNESGILATGGKKATEKQIQEAAIREVAEEGGVEANIVDKINTIKYYFTVNNKTISKFVTFFLMEWQRDLPEGHDEETSEIDWLPFGEALKLLDYENEKELLIKAKELLEKT